MKKRGKRLEPDEVFRRGPFQAARFGRVVQLSSDFAPGEYAALVQRLREARPKVKEAIDAKISEVIQLFRQYDTIDMLTLLALIAPLSLEGDRDFTYPHLEYAISMVAALGVSPTGVPPIPETSRRQARLITEVFRDFSSFYGSEFAEGKVDRETSSLKYESLAWHTGVRGDSYPAHHLDLVRSFLYPHDDFVLAHFDVSVEELLSTVIDVIQSINDRLSAFYESFQSSVTKLFNNPNDESSDFPPVNTWRNLFSVDMKGKLAGVLKRLSLDAGADPDFLTNPKTLGWPSSESAVNLRPLLRSGESTFCFDPNLLFSNLLTIVESWIDSESHSYFTGSYSKARDAILTNLTMSYLRNVLPGSIAATHVFYKTTEKGEVKRPEVDGIAVLDGNLLVIESKGGRFTAPARRGAPDRIARDFDTLVGDAFDQGFRTLQYVLSTAEAAEFTNEAGHVVLSFDPRSLRNLFVLNVTLASLGFVSAKMHSIPLLQGRTKVASGWSVFINDLRVVTDLLRGPSEFFLYLTRRLEMNKIKQFQPVDELDILGYFMTEGLFFDGRPPENEHVLIDGYTDPMDRYYGREIHSAPTGEKPRFAIAVDFRMLIESIELSERPLFTMVGTTLLALDGSTRADILAQIGRTIAAFDADGKTHDFSMLFHRLAVGLSFVRTAESPDKWLSGKQHFFHLKLLSTQMESWIVIALATTGARCETFRVYSLSDALADTVAVAELATYRLKKNAAYVRLHGQPGRNDLCPCNSGKKYKFCCGR